MGTGAQGGYYAVTTRLPTSSERNYRYDSAGYLTVSIAVLRYERRYSGGQNWPPPTFLVFAVGAGAIALIYTSVPFGDAAMLVLGFPLGFFASGVFSAMGPFFTEQFPTRVRGVGQGFAYNVGRATGALFPTLVGVLSARMALGHAIGTFAGLAYATMGVAAFLLPETRGKTLA